MALTPIQRFCNTLTNPVTRKNYEFQLNKFWKWGKFTPEAFTKMDKPKRRDKVLEYIQFNKIKTEKCGSPAPSSYSPMIASIISFCDSNEVEMNWKIIKKTIPKITHLSNQYPYTDEDIEKMLSVVGNLRDVAFIHLMASTAPRIGEVNEIKIRSIIPIEDGAILVMYAGQVAEYKVPMTPEAYGHIKNYLDSRKNVNPDSALFATNGLTERPMKADSVKEFMKRFRNKVENLEKNGKRKDKATNNAFRKRLQICYSMAKIDYRFADYFLNHNLGQQDPNYFRRMTDEQIWEAFKPTIPYITLDKSKKIELQKNEEIKTIKESYQGEFKEKLESLEEQIVSLTRERAESNFYDFHARHEERSRIGLMRTLFVGEIEEYNQACELLGTGYKELRIPPLNDSEKMMMEKWGEFDERDSIKSAEKRGVSKKDIEAMKQRYETKFKKKCK